MAKSLTRVGFEPTPQGDCEIAVEVSLKYEPEHSALDHSAILPCTIQTEEGNA